MTDIAVHRIVVPSERMRKLRDDVVDSLAESIAERGLLQPIIVRPRGATNYWLVAGRHRLEAVRKCGHNRIRAVILNGLDADAALLAEIDENLVRADLSPAERALHVARRKELYEKIHPQTKKGAAPGAGRGKKRRSQESQDETFVSDMAKKVGKGRSTVARDVTRANKVVVLADIVGTALDEGEEIDALAKLPQDEQRKLAARVKSGERVTAKHVAKKLQREARVRDLAVATEVASQALGEKVYSVIYADPPWKFEVHAESGEDKNACNHYPVMPTEKIKVLPIPAAEDAVLFLWATVPMLPQTLDVMSAWGFTYKSLIVWDKGREGTGYWIRNRVEILLIGTRGAVPAPAPGEQPPQVIEAPRGRHSEKPVVFAEYIERLFPNVPKLEMFARKARPGWDVWGNEVPPMEATCPNGHPGAVPLSEEEALAKTWTRKKA
jgi:ParB/RepB/Spo0J family partition protein